MTTSPKCPAPEQWEELLHADAAEPENPELQSHLETCERCRQTLEELVADDE